MPGKTRETSATNIYAVSIQRNALTNKDESLSSSSLLLFLLSLLLLELLPLLELFKFLDCGLAFCCCPSVEGDFWSSFAHFDPDVSNHVMALEAKC